MSFDAFEARLQFLQLLRKLNASSQSIQKVVAFAIKFGSRCGEDLWECVLEETAKGTLNTRINILYFLDSLLDTSLSLGPADAPYPAFIARDLSKVVLHVVPADREGILNLRSAKQILDSWRTRRVLDQSIIDEVLKQLEARKTGGESPRKRSREDTFSRNDILRRMEEDRERHKRLRERIWILPIPPLQPRSALPSIATNPSPSSSSPFTPASPSTLPDSTRSATDAKSSVNDSGGESLAASELKVPVGSALGKMLPPPRPDKGRGGESALEVEFEQMWEATSDLGDDDLDKMRHDSWTVAT